VIRTELRRPSTPRRQSWNRSRFHFLDPSSLAAYLGAPRLQAFVVVERDAGAPRPRPGEYERRISGLAAPGVNGHDAPLMARVEMELAEKVRQTLSILWIA
jgi:hypothetical protein